MSYGETIEWKILLQWQLSHTCAKCWTAVSGICWDFKWHLIKLSEILAKSLPNLSKLFALKLFIVFMPETNITGQFLCVWHEISTHWKICHLLTEKYKLELENLIWFYFKKGKMKLRLWLIMWDLACIRYVEVASL